MVADDERREVARRLRELDYSDLQESLICAYLDALGIKGYEDWIGIAHRLADLIEPSEPKVKCVAEVKFDGERLEQPAYDAAVEPTGIDRDAIEYGLTLAQFKGSEEYLLKVRSEDKAFYLVCTGNRGTHIKV